MSLLDRRTILILRPNGEMRDIVAARLRFVPAARLRCRVRASFRAGPIELTERIALRNHQRQVHRAAGKIGLVPNQFITVPTTVLESVMLKSDRFFVFTSTAIIVP